MMRPRPSVNARSEAEDLGEELAPQPIQLLDLLLDGGTHRLDLRERLRCLHEHGALHAANVLKSERAVVMSVYVIRTFVQLREQIAANAAVLKRLAEIDKTLLEHGSALRAIWTRLQPLLSPPPDPPEPRIGFQR